MVHVPLMFFSEWSEFPWAPSLARKETWWQLASPCCWNRARRLTCFLSASVTRKDLQFGTWTDPLSNDTIDSVLRRREVCRAKDLSAPPRIWMSVIPAVVILLPAESCSSCAIQRATTGLQVCCYSGKLLCIFKDVAGLSTHIPFNSSIFLRKGNSQEMGV